MEDAISSQVVIIVHTQQKVAEKAEADLLRNDTSTLIATNRCSAFWGKPVLHLHPNCLEATVFIDVVEDVLISLL
jgi:hypothetical protein